MIDIPEKPFDVIGLNMDDFETAIGKLVNWGFIQESRLCNRCHYIMTLAYGNCFDDHVYYRCRNIECQKKCSIKFGTIYERSKLKIIEIASLFAIWCGNMSIRTATMFSILSDSSISYHFQLFREFALKIFFHDLNKNPLGGDRMKVQVDESLFGKAKYHIGKNLAEPQYWVFEIVDDASGRVFMQHVKNRKSETLIPIIFDKVKTGSAIISDQWKPYNKIPFPEYFHFTVNHSKNFVDPLTNEHTQKAESYWNAAKDDLTRKHIRDRSQYESYIQEWCFRKNLARDFQSCWKVMLTYDFS